MPGGNSLATDVPSKYNNNKTENIYTKYRVKCAEYMQGQGVLWKQNNNVIALCAL